MHYMLADPMTMHWKMNFTQKSDVFIFHNVNLNPPSIQNLNKLMSTQDDNTIFQLIIFLYKLFELRKK